MSKLSKDEIERWITLNNGVHVPIKKGETEEDVKKRLDNWSNQNSNKKSYHDYKDDKKKMTAQFMANNPVMVDDKVVEAIDYDVLANGFFRIIDEGRTYLIHPDTVLRVEAYDVQE